MANSHLGAAETGFLALLTLVHSCRKERGREAGDAWSKCSIWGLKALQQRIYGIAMHHAALYKPQPHPVPFFDYELSTLFFHMQSSVETVVYALNGLGSTVSVGGFIDPEKGPKALVGVGPHNVVGKEPQKGYPQVFPTFNDLWMRQKDLLDLVKDLHNHSKHRAFMFSGGQLNTTGEGAEARIATPMIWEEVILMVREDIIVPDRFRKPNGNVPVDPIVLAFSQLLSATAAALLDDTQRHVLEPLQRARQAIVDAGAGAP